MEPKLGAFDIYKYDPDTGHLCGIKRGVQKNFYKRIADRWHFEEKYIVEVYDRTDDRLVYSLVGIL